MWTRLRSCFGRRLLWHAFIASILGVAGGAGIAGESDGARDIVREHSDGSESQSGNKWAILIGDNKYLDPAIQPLRYAVNDVRRMEKTLANCGYSRDRMLVMHDELERNAAFRIPNRINILDQVGKFLELTEQGDTVLFFFSGHGFLDNDGQAYLAPVDCTIKDLGTRGIRVDDLRNLLKNCRATRKLMILDCCHSGSSKGEPDSSSIAANNKIIEKNQVDSEGMITIASCAKDQRSYEWSDKESGIFTYFLAEALSGRADDREGGVGNQDGIVDADEINKYLTKKVPATSLVVAGQKQTPKYIRGDDATGTFEVARVSHVIPAILRSVTATFSVREKSSGSPVGNAKVELVYRADSNSPLKSLGRDSTDQHGAAQMDVDLSPGQEKQGEFLAVVSLGGIKHEQLLERFPKTLKQDLEINGEFTNKIGMQLKWIPPGTFKMGLSKGENAKEPPDSKQHEVEITRGFFLGKYEVTVEQFSQFVDDVGYKTWAETGGENGNAGGSYFDPRRQQDKTSVDYNWRTPGFEQGRDHPVVQVNYADAIAFCQWLGKQDGGTYRLPTEAEWEYACRAGHDRIYGESDAPKELAAIANVRDDEFERRLGPRWLAESNPVVDINDGFAMTAPVGKYRANGFGLYDMLGNVYEMCEDWYSPSYYGVAPRRDPTGPRDGESRVARGGSWFSSARYATCSRRRYRPPNVDSPDGCDYHTGFRVAWDP